MRLAELTDRVLGLNPATTQHRVLVGIAGEPGAGKTTLAVALVRSLQARLGDGVAVHVPMDGFHLADVALSRLGRTDRKGAPDTFDTAGYLALLRRLRDEDGPIWAPAFDRDLEQPIAGSIEIGPAARIVVSEGNYLLLDQAGWAEIGEYFGEIWFCSPNPDERRRRLISRHEQFGKSPEAARARALGPDERNAELVRAGRDRADLVIDVDVDVVIEGDAES